MRAAPERAESAVTLRKVGRYEIMREIGTGGMATIYLAYDPESDRSVAIKLLHAQFIRDPQFRTRFMREARILADLEHPNIVPVLDFGGENSLPYIVMRYMPGGTLEDRIAGRPMPLAQIVPIVQNIAAALDYAHAAGIIHRDLKPSNILFDERGYGSLSDFGLAKLAERVITRLTFSGAMVGTLDYMSPEQAMGEQEVDARSDVYSFGVILYEMLTGHVPHAADTPMKVLYKHMTESPPSLEVKRPGLPPGYNDVIARALARKPDDRYATAGEFAAAVTSLWNGPLRPSPLRNADGIEPVPPRSSIRSRSFSPKSRPSAILPVRLPAWAWMLGGVLATMLCLSLAGVTLAAMNGGGLLLFGATATGTPTATATASATATATATTTSTPTWTPTATSTDTPTATATELPTETATAPPPTDTPRPVVAPTQPPRVVTVIVQPTAPPTAIPTQPPPTQPPDNPPPPTDTPVPP